MTLQLLWGVLQLDELTHCWVVCEGTAKDIITTVWVGYLGSRTEKSCLILLNFQANTLVNNVLNAKINTREVSEVGINMGTGRES